MDGVRRGNRGAAYLVLGAAGAALVGWLVYAFTLTVIATSGGDRIMVIVLAVVALGIAAAVLLSPPVRDAEVAMARPLLGVELPAVRDRHSWDSRWRGAAWAGWVLLVGGVAAFVLLAGVPGGISLALSGPGRGAQALWRMPLGVLVVVGSFVIQTGFAWLLVRTAPRLLGPTAQDRLALAAEREQALARGNELARELHDTIGHSLTAISVQAEAGRAVGAVDPRAAQRALERISASASVALEELDSVLGLLRGARAGRSRAQLRALVAAAATPEPSVLELAGDWDSLPDPTSAQVFRVIQEGLTNAAKHGCGAARVHVIIDADVIVTVTNSVAPQQDSPPSGGRGLTGLRERMTLLGGSLQSGASPDGKEWTLCARLPQS